jgi:hypothetical protein
MGGKSQSKSAQKVIGETIEEIGVEFAFKNCGQHCCH